MTAIRSTKTAPMEDMTAKPAFPGCRAIVTAAAVIAFGLFAAPLQADHETFDVTVTLEATAGDGQVELTATHTASSSVTGAAVAGEIIDCLFQEKRADADWGDSWWNMSECRNTVGDLENGTAYSFRSKAFRATRDSEGGLHFAYSEPSEAVTVTPGASTQ